MLRALFLCALVASAAFAASDVVDAHDDDFESVISSSPFVLMEFYAPWCGHCKKLVPEWEKAATLLKGTAVVAKLDATVEKSAAAKFDIKGFPTIKVFRDGKLSGQYDGPRTAEGIVKYVKSNSGPAVHVVSTTEALEKLKNDNQVTVALFSADKVAAFEDAAKALRATATFVHVTATAAYDSTEGSIVVYKKFDDPRERYSGELNAADIQAFVTGASVRLFDEIGPDNYKMYVDRGIPMGWLFVNPSAPATEAAKKSVADVAKEFSGKISLIWIDAGKYGQMAERLGLKAGEFPAFAIDKDGAHYTHTGEFTAEIIRNFLKNFFDGSLAPTVRSEEAPEPHTVEGLTTVVGSTFDALVDNADVDVFIEFYAPWCGHCKKLAPIYKKLAKALENVPHVRIAQLDGTTNDYNSKKYKVEGFPTLMWIPKNTHEPKAYSGDRSFDAMLKFIKKEASSTVDVTVKEEEL